MFWVLNSLFCDGLNSATTWIIENFKLGRISWQQQKSCSDLVTGFVTLDFSVVALKNIKEECHHTIIFFVKALIGANVKIMKDMLLRKLS